MASNEETTDVTDSTSVNEAGDQTSTVTTPTSDTITESKQNVNTECIQTDKPVSDPGGDTTETNQTENCDSATMETVTFKVIYNKQKYDVTFPIDKTVLELKKHVQTLTGVPSAMQKIMFKGLAKDQSTLKDLKVTNGAKVMVVGSTMNDVLQVTNTPTAKELQEEEKAATSKEPLSLQKQHKKVLDKYGKPDDVLPGVKNTKEQLPHYPLTGMYNKAGGKVRLTFKLELDQLWLGTKERTEKLPMNSIKAVVSEPLSGHEEYHMLYNHPEYCLTSMCFGFGHILFDSQEIGLIIPGEPALQLGPTEASRYWIYWVPAQYVDAIKDTILGKWQLF